MTPEEIQAIRAKYNYNPESLITGQESSARSTSARLAALRGELPEKVAEKTLGQKVAGVAGEIIKPIERVGGGILNMLPGEDQATRTGLFGNEVSALGYRDGQKLQGGELAKDVAGTILDVGSYAVPIGTGAKVLTKVAKGIKAGATTGAMVGTGRALQEGDTVEGALVEGMVGAGTGALIGGAIPGVSSGATAIKNKLNPSEKFIESKILKEYTKGVKPLLPGKTTPNTLANYNDNVVKAVKTIKNNKDNLIFEGEAGDMVTGKTPSNRNELTSAVEQTKKKIFSEYDSLAKTAGKSGVTVDVNPIAKELDIVVNDKALAITNPGAINHAKQLQDRLVQTGTLDAQTAQDVIQNYNKSLEAFYRNPTYENASNAAIDAVVANNMRKALDDGITGLTGSEYQALKNQYGALKAIEKDVIKASLRDARKNVKGLIDFTDIFSGGQVVSGLASMNPATIATGAAQKAITELYKHLNDPNRAISKMFEAADIPVGGVVGKISKELKNPEYRRGMVNPSELLPKKKVVSSLEQEAKKYKSAEEFATNSTELTYKNLQENPYSIKAYGKDFNEPVEYYRAGAIRKNGDIWLTDNQAGAQQYSSAGGGTKVGSYIVNSKKPLIIDTAGGKYAKGNIDINKILTKEEIAKGYTNNPDIKQKFIDYAKNNGYDAVQFADSFPDGEGGMRSLVVWDKNRIKTKSQLIDIWNKANKK